MENNSISKISENASAIIKAATNKKFIRRFTFGYVILFAAALILFIVGISLGETAQTWIITMSGVVALVITVIIFFVLEYLRRVAFYYYETKFNFPNLYETPLLEEKVLEQPAQILSDLDKSFFKQHLEVLNRQYSDVNLTQNYGNYDILMQGGHYVFSYCQARCYAKTDENRMLIGKQLKRMQIIVATDTKLPECLLSVGNGNLQSIKSIDSWSRRDITDLDLNNLAIYSGKENDKAWTSLVALAKQFKQLGICQLEIKIKHGKIFYCLDLADNALLFGLGSFKPNNLNWEKISAQYTDSLSMVSKILTIIQYVQ